MYIIIYMAVSWCRVRTIQFNNINRLNNFIANVNVASLLSSSYILMFHWNKITTKNSCVHSANLTISGCILNRLEICTKTGYTPVCSFVFRFMTDRTAGYYDDFMRHVFQSCYSRVNLIVVSKWLSLLEKRSIYILNRTKTVLLLHSILQNNYYILL